MTSVVARMRRLPLAVALGLTIALPTASCTGPDRSSAPPAKTTPPSAFTGKWAKLATPCPTLTGETATSLGRTGPGTPGPGNVDTPVKQIASCNWGDGNGFVEALVVVNRLPGPPATEEQTSKDFQESFDKLVADGWVLYWKPEPGLEDKAYLGIYRGQSRIHLSVLSSNAEITISYQIGEIEESTWDKALAQHRGTMRGLLADVLDDLNRR